MNVHADLTGDHQTTPARHGAEVEFHAVSKTYGPVTALLPTTLRIEAGEFFAIIGPSGSGKSTLLGITAGFIVPSGGTILIDGTDIVSTPPYSRNFGMVFQNYALFPHMTVAENIGFPLRMRGVAKPERSERVSRALARVRLEGLGDRRPAQLSGGQQQRVALARASVYDPLLLLMDEPLGALDKNLREEMQEEIKKFQQALGVTVIYVTHDQQEAASMADRLAIMRGGKLEQIGSPRELYERPETVFVAGFLGEASILPVVTVTASGKGAVRAELENGIAIEALAHGTIGNALCIRPECVLVGKEAETADNRFEARVEEAVYANGSVRYRLRLVPSGHLITARLASRPDLVVMKPGQKAKVGWARRDVRLIEGKPE
jgi:putative spermidine/putrescine transport system ATP-binding protein